jgi:Fic family protein
MVVPCIETLRLAQHHPHSEHIEGTQLTLEQSQAVWEGKDAGPTNADDVRELLNYRDAFQLVSEYLSSGLPITETLIRSIHQKPVEGVRGGEGGSLA